MATDTLPELGSIEPNRHGYKEFALDPGRPIATNARAAASTSATTANLIT